MSMTVYQRIYLKYLTSQKPRSPDRRPLRSSRLEVLQALLPKRSSRDRQSLIEKLIGWRTVTPVDNCKPYG